MKIKNVDNLIFAISFQYLCLKSLSEAKKPTRSLMIDICYAFLKVNNKSPVTFQFHFFSHLGSFIGDDS